MKRLSVILLICFACEDGDMRVPNDCLGPSKGNGACPAVVEPVCGCNGVTYQNSCHAELAGVKSWTDGECE